MYVVISEKSKLREEIIARRQKKHDLRHARRKLLEEVALRESELQQELDRYRLLINLRRFFCYFKCLCQ